MSHKEIRNLSKGDIKYKLSQMGMSFDRTNYPKEYYVQLYLDKSNAKNKVTRDNTPFYKEKIINRKRERIKSSRMLKKDQNKEDNFNSDDDDDPNYEEEEYEEEEEINDISNDSLYIEEKKR